MFRTGIHTNLLDLPQKPHGYYQGPSAILGLGIRMGVLYGLIAATCWGLGDFAITSLARQVGTAKCLLLIQIFSLLSWIGLIWVFPHTARASVAIWGIAALAGVFHVVGLVTTYRAFEIGTLSFVSPIASSFAIVTALLYVVTGKSPAPLALVGTLLLVCGIVVVTRATPSDGPITVKGVPEAITSAIGFGIMFWLIDVYVKEPLGDVFPLILLKVMVTSYAAIATAREKKTDAPVPDMPRVKIWQLAVLAALLDSAAWVATLFGYKHENGAVVIALASLFSVVTIVMAWVFLKERLNRLQWIGVSVVLVGVLLVSLPR